MRKLLSLFFVAAVVIMVYVVILVRREIMVRARSIIGKEIAHYVVDNDGYFPTNWSALTKHSIERVDRGEHQHLHAVYIRNLEGEFSLPWGESITNTSALSRDWFKSVTRSWQKHDRLYSKIALCEMWGFATNRPVVRNYVEAALEKY